MIDRVPIDANGNWQSYPYYSHGWDYNTTITARMKIDGMYSGRSAKGIVLEDLLTGRKYHMFIADFVEAAQSLIIVTGHFEEMLWTASKRGTNYGIKPLMVNRK